MATLHLTDTTLTVRFTRAEKVLALVRDVEIPRAAVRDVSVAADALAAVRGLRAPGLGLPHRRVGTWRSPGEKMLVSVRRGPPALRIRLAGQRYDTLLIGADDAVALAARLAPEASGA